MTAVEIRQALLNRWTPDKYLVINEAPQTPDRMGRKLDVVVISLWRSRGYELDWIEIKCSTSDWKRELDNPAKADWWWQHVHRFWIAAPVEIASRIRETLPSGWGLLACSEHKTQELVK